MWLKTRWRASFIIRSYPRSLELSARTRRVSFLTSPSRTKSSYHTSHRPRYNFPTSMRLSESVGDCVILSTHWLTTRSESAGLSLSDGQFAMPTVPQCPSIHVKLSRSAISSEKMKELMSKGTVSLFVGRGICLGMASFRIRLGEPRT